jgi:hypothetical protein
MIKTESARYTLEFKPVAVPAFEEALSTVGAARTWGVVDTIGSGHSAEGLIRRTRRCK